MSDVCRSSLSASNRSIYEWCNDICMLSTLICMISARNCGIGSGVCIISTLICPSGPLICIFSTPNCGIGSSLGLRLPRSTNGVNGNGVCCSSLGSDFRCHRDGMGWDGMGWDGMGWNGRVGVGVGVGVA
jgi:hypothetical protein